MGTSLVAGKKQKQKFSVAMQTEEYQRVVKETLRDPEAIKLYNSSILSTVATNRDLQKCTSASLLGSSLYGFSLGLLPLPQLGQFYLVPFEKQLRDPNTGKKLWAEDANGKKLLDGNGKWIPVTETEAVFVCGYKGYIQMALKSGYYHKLNVLEIKEGELKNFDPLNEVIDCILIDDFDKRESAPTIGYYAMFEYMNGFRKAMYWSKEKMISHADKYSPAFNRNDYQKYLRGDYDQKEAYKYSSFWYKDFDTMGKKTMIRQLLSHWGVLSTELQRVIMSDDRIINVSGSELIADEDDLIPEPIGQIFTQDMKPEFDAVEEKVNLEDL